MAKCCNSIFIPAFFDFKCPECGKQVDMTNREKYENQQICDLIVDTVKMINEENEKK